MLIQIAVTLTVLLAFCGLALDVGMMQLKKLQLQNAADAAALGGAFLMGSGAAGWQAAGQADASLNGFTNGVNGVTVNLVNPPNTGQYANHTSAVQATVTQTVNPIFFPGTRTVTAVAAALIPSYACAYFMSAYSTGPSFNMYNKSIQGSCRIYTGLSYFFDSVSSSSGYQFISAGSSAASSGTVSPTAKFNYSPTADPLNLVPPYPGGCDVPAQSFTSSETISPANSCGNVTIQGTASNPITITMNPGVYSIAGNVTVQYATITGSGVMFYIRQQSGYGNTWKISNSQFNVSAPTTGPWQGLLFFSDRGLPPVPPSQQSSTPIVSFSSLSSQSTLDGIMYLPGQEVSSSNSTLQGSHYFGIVSDWASLSSTALVLSSDYSSLQAGNPFHPTVGALVQ